MKIKFYKELSDINVVYKQLTGEILKSEFKELINHQWLLSKAIRLQYEHNHCGHSMPPNPKDYTFLYHMNLLEIRQEIDEFLKQDLPKEDTFYFFVEHAGERLIFPVV